jgi:hypothetical protein
MSELKEDEVAAEVGKEEIGEGGKSHEGSGVIIRTFLFLSTKLDEACLELIVEIDFLRA